MLLWWLQTCPATTMSCGDLVPPSLHLWSRYLSAMTVKIHTWFQVLSKVCQQTGIPIILYILTLVLKKKYEFLQFTWCKLWCLALFPTSWKPNPEKKLKHFETSGPSTKDLGWRLGWKKIFASQWLGAKDARYVAQKNPPRILILCEHPQGHTKTSVDSVCIWIRICIYIYLCIYLDLQWSTLYTVYNQYINVISNMFV